MMIDLRPICSFDTKHGADAPSRAEHIEGFREAVIVNDSSVDREDSHQEYDVATGKHHVKYLQRGKKKDKVVWNLQCPRPILLDNWVNLSRARQVKFKCLVVDLARCMIPHCHSSGRGDDSLGEPGKAQHMSSIGHVPCHQTSQQTGRGM